ncbi:MAG: hypothetical protein PHX02_07355 [Oscillospiraceae bacterium]|nr:hypothetical protein [Oscillospiraceae bacterium]
MQYDDSDMKIASDDFKKTQQIVDDTEQMANLLKREKSNGNLARARRLGAVMAEDVASIEGENPACDTAHMTQRRILLAFAVEIGLNTVLPNKLLSETAQSIFYDTLRTTASTFYDDLQKSGAFSFYYLCVREAEEVEKCVGETFATLCGCPGDKKIAKMGTDLFTHFINQVHTFAKTMGFVTQPEE